MAIHLGDCPRCKAKHTTFDVWHACVQSEDFDDVGYHYLIEAFLQCRHCHGTSIIQCITYNDEAVKSLHRISDVWPYLEWSGIAVRKFLTLADIQVSSPPEYLPQNIHDAFVEGARCYAAGCYNAAGAMFRLSLDLASKSLLPADDSEITINSRQKNYLADRLEWLFDNKHWPASLKDMVTCIRQDGNDGAHDGELGEDEAFDIMDFSFKLLEKIYTEPERIRISQERRASRKKQ